MAPGTSVILVLLLIVLALSEKFTPRVPKRVQPRVTAIRLPGGHMEVVEQETCSEGVLRLTCRSLRAFLIVLEAGYVPNRSDFCGKALKDGNDDEGALKVRKNHRKTHNQLKQLRGNYIDDATESGEESFQADLRISMNRRCSGLQHCRFDINSDHPEATFWTPANVRLKYACLPEAAIGKYCNRKLSVVGGEGGYLKSPGYPLYYTGGTTCGWTFESQPGQRISLTLHDLNIRSAEQDGSCVDVIRVRENGVTLLESCGTAAGVQVISESNVITLDLIALSNLYPSRGFLLQYRAIGCPEVVAPEGSYIVNDTGEVKTFLCKTGTVFPDTRTRSKLIRCKHGLWTGVTELNSCVDTSAAILKAEGGTTGRYTASLTDEPGVFSAGFRPSSGIVERSSDANAMGSTTIDPAMVKHENYVVDIVLPTLLIALLLVGNAVIVYVIFQYRKRKQPAIGRGDAAEEMALRSSTEGGVLQV